MKFCPNGSVGQSCTGKNTGFPNQSYRFGPSSTVPAVTNGKNSNGPIASRTRQALKRAHEKNQVRWSEDMERSSRGDLLARECEGNQVSWSENMERSRRGDSLAGECEENQVSKKSEVENILSGQQASLVIQNISLRPHHRRYSLRVSVHDERGKLEGGDKSEVADEQR